MVAALLGLIALGIVGALVALSVQGIVERRRAFAAGCEAQGRFHVLRAGSLWAWPLVALDHGRLKLQLSPAEHGGTNSNQKQHTWDVKVARIRLGHRTDLSIGYEGALSKAASLLGLKDVEIGNEDFDARYRIQGRDEDLVRAVMSDTEVQDAVRGLFSGSFSNEKPVRKLRLDDAGTLQVSLTRNDLHVGEATEVADAVVRLAEALDAVHDAQRVPAQGEHQGGVGGATGAPVGVSVLRD